MMIKETTLPEILPATFAALCKLHLPKPIADKVDYQNTAEMVDRLATLEKRSRGQEQYLETLTILIEKYDQDLPAAVISDPIDRLKRLMENRELSASDLGRLLGNRSLGAAILRGDRKISKVSAIKLGEFFKMSPAAFLQI